MKIMSFTERMAQGKEIAQLRRDRGLDTTVHASHKYTRHMIGLDAIEQYYNQWRKDVHINAYCAVEYELFKDMFAELTP